MELKQLGSTGDKVPTKPPALQEIGDAQNAPVVSPVLDISSDVSDYMSAHQKFCDMLSKYRNEDAEEKSEGSRLKFANIALNEYNADGDDYELVELGPLALGSIDDDGFKLQEPGPLAPGLGSIPKGCLILHLNFKAKHNNEPHAVVETFFSELIKINEDDVRVVTVRCLGPTNLLPEKPATYGCLYCYLRNIHHPDDPLSFLRGGKYRFNFLFSVVPKISKYVRDGEKQHFIPLSFHPEVQFIHKFDKIESTSAAVALRMLNKKEKWNLELVKISAFGRVTLSIGFFLHINFEAKDKNNPDAPVQMFFAEVIFRNPTFFLRLLQLLGIIYFLNR